MPRLTIAEIDDIISGSQPPVGYFWDGSYHTIACTLEYHRQEHPTRNEYGWPNYDSNGVDRFARDCNDDPVQIVLEIDGIRELLNDFRCNAVNCDQCCHKINCHDKNGNAISDEWQEFTALYHRRGLREAVTILMPSSSKYSLELQQAMHEYHYADRITRFRFARNIDDENKIDRLRAKFIRLMTDEAGSVFADIRDH